MAVAEPYAATKLVPARTRIAASPPEYLRGSAASWVALGALALLFVIAIFAKEIAPYNPLVPAGLPQTAPNASNWFGTDTVGRDVLSRVLAGMAT